MTNDELNADDRFNELDGRIEAISCLLLQLTAALEINDSIIGTDITIALRRRADNIKLSNPDVLTSAKRALLDLARMLDDARTIRQKRGHQA